MCYTKVTWVAFCRINDVLAPGRMMLDRPVAWRSLHRVLRFGEEDSAKQIPMLRIDCCSVRQACNRPRNTVRCHHNDFHHHSRVAAIGKAYDKRTIILEHDRASTEALRQPLRLGLRHTAALRAQGTLTEAIKIHQNRPWHYLSTLLTPASCG